MTSPFAAPEPSHAADRQADDAAYYRRVLHDFIEMGAELARLVVQEARMVAEAAPPAGDPGAASQNAGPERAVAFERIARAVRRSIMLARALDEPVPHVDHTGARRRATRQRIIRTVAGKLDRATPSDLAELSDAELQERLDADEAEEAIDPQMAAEIIAEICHDLGLAGVPEEIRVRCARAARREELQDEGDAEPARMSGWMRAGAGVPDG